LKKEQIDLSHATNYIETSNNLFFSPEEIIEAAWAEDSAPVSTGAETKDAVPQPKPAAPSSEVEPLRSGPPVEIQPVPTKQPIVLEYPFFSPVQIENIP
jgi:hypothetical protein